MEPLLELLAQIAAELASQRAPRALPLRHPQSEHSLLLLPEVFSRLPQVHRVFLVKDSYCRVVVGRSSELALQYRAVMHQYAEHRLTFRGEHYLSFPHPFVILHVVIHLGAIPLFSELPCAYHHGEVPLCELHLVAILLVVHRARMEQALQTVVHVQWDSLVRRRIVVVDTQGAAACVAADIAVDTVADADSMAVVAVQDRDTAASGAAGNTVQALLEEVRRDIQDAPAVHREQDDTPEAAYSAAVIVDTAIAADMVAAASAVLAAIVAAVHIVAAELVVRELVVAVFDRMNQNYHGEAAELAVHLLNLRVRVHPAMRAHLPSAGDHFVVVHMRISPDYRDHYHAVYTTNDLDHHDLHHEEDRTSEHPALHHREILKTNPHNVVDRDGSPE